MQDAETISALIADIYDAALEPEQWPRVLGLICDFVGGHGSTLFAHDSARPHATLFFNYRNDPKYLQLYAEKYIHMNPLMPAVTFHEVGRVFTVGDLVSDAELKATRFYSEFQQPQGIIDAMFVNLEKSGTSHMTMSLIASEQTGVFDAQKRQRLALLVPHVRRAVLIGHIIAGHDAEKAALASALSRVASAVFLVDAVGRIAFANERAVQMTEDGKMLRSEQGILAAVAPDANQVLREAFAAARNGDAAVGGDAVAISLTASTSERWLAHVLPLTSGVRRQAGAAHSAVAAVFVRKAGLDSRSPLEALAKIYKLTATEVRVLQGVVEIGGTRQIAEALGVAETTAKTHLQSLYAKIGVNRQVDLVKLVAEYASPFGPPPDA